MSDERAHPRVEDAFLDWEKREEACQTSQYLGKPDARTLASRAFYAGAKSAQGGAEKDAEIGRLRSGFQEARYMFFCESPDGPCGNCYPCRAEEVAERILGPRPRWTQEEIDAVMTEATEKRTLLRELDQPENASAPPPTVQRCTAPSCSNGLVVPGFGLGPLKNKCRDCGGTGWVGGVER